MLPYHAFILRPTEGTFFSFKVKHLFNKRGTLRRIQKAINLPFAGELIELRRQLSL